MKYPAIAMIFIAVIFVVGCSDEDSTATTAKDSAESLVQKLLVAPELPIAIKGLAFELGGKCAIDTINSPQAGEVISISRTDVINVDGWAFDDKHGDVPPVVVLQLAKGEDRYHALLSRHGGRDDLIQSFGKPELGEAGYSGTVDISSLPAGLYEILIIQRGDRKNMVCSTYRKLALND